MNLVNPKQLYYKCENGMTINLTHYQYPTFNYTRVYMPKGSDQLIPAAENDKSICVLCTLGGTIHNPQHDVPSVHLPQAEDKMLLNDENTGWSNETKGHHDLHLYAPQDTEWVCVGINETGYRPKVIHKIVTNKISIPKRTGVIVVTGAFEDTIIDQYILPSDKKYTLTGNGDIFLIN